MMKQSPTTSTTLLGIVPILAVIVSLATPCRAWVHPAQVVTLSIVKSSSSSYSYPSRATDLRQSRTANNNDDYGGGGGGDVNGNNVVFRPSADPNAFDSYKIGSARVHRYTEPGSDAAYVMWYHGRDAILDSSTSSSSASSSPSPPLPPLSTGRIGRATSRNGLLWRRDDEGSVDSDRIGTSLGLNVDSWYGFDTSHIGLGQVLLPMTTPSIRSEGGV